MDAKTDLPNHVAALRDIMGEAYVRLANSENASFLKDWSGDYTAAPMCIALPGSTSEVAATLAYCHAQGLSVIPQGGNSGLVGGCFTDDSETTVIVNLSRMNRIRDLDRLNYTATVEAGCIVQTLQDAAAQQDRLFPLSFGAEGSAQIGGALATNAGGLNVLRYGMTRDLVLGLEAVLADGTILSDLTQLRKDNRGLDLKQLLIGSEGSLAIITAVTVKLFPAPTVRETAILAVPSLDDVIILFDLARSHCADLLTAFELVPRACLELALNHQSSLRDPLASAYETYVVMELSCSGPLDLRGLAESFLEKAMTEGWVEDGAMAESLSQSQDFWALREAMVEAQAAHGRHLRTDVSIPVSKVPAFIAKATAQLNQMAPEWDVLPYGHIGDGNIHLNALPPKGLDDQLTRDIIPTLLDAIYDVVDELGGSLSAEHGIGRSRLAPFEARQAPLNATLTRGIKSLFDPTTQLNPGCLFSTPTEGN